MSESVVVYVLIIRGAWWSLVVIPVHSKLGGRFLGGRVKTLKETLPLPTSLKFQQGVFFSFLHEPQLPIRN